MDIRKPRHFGDVNLDGSSQAHLGDIINHYHQADGNQSREAQEAALLESLNFEGMGRRARNVAMALPETCQWVLSHETFQIWGDDQGGRNRQNLLWIKGKPGSGKSTIMKEILQWAKTTWSTSLNLSFYFNARAHGELEKNSLGLYQSLVYQLLSSCVPLRTRFYEMFLPGSSNPQAQIWTPTELQNFLSAVVRDSTLPQLNVFIDALDEGADDDVRNMLHFFQDLIDTSTRRGFVFRLCLSSRHYPRISVQRSLELILENQTDHARDIERYIGNRLRGGDHGVMEDLAKRLLQRSNGVFQWVVLAISILNPLLDRGRDLAVIRTELESIPEELSDLYMSMLARDPRDFEECITLLRCVLYSKRPLHAVELYVAIKSKHKSTDVDEVLTSTRVDHFYKQCRDLVSRYILDCSRGLVEETRDHHIQFIHETVRATLLNRGVYVAATSSNNSPDLSASCGHSVMTDICFSCLKFVMGMGDNRQKRVRHLFAPYAATYWWQHISAIDDDHSAFFYNVATDLLTADFFKFKLILPYFDIDQDHLHGLSQERRSFIGTNFRHPTDTPITTPAVYYAANLGIPRLVDTLIASGADVNNGMARFDSPLQAASYRGHVTVVRQLLAAGAKLDLNEKNYCSALRAATVNSHAEVVQVLIAAYSHRLALDSSAAAVVRNALLSAGPVKPADPIAAMLETACRELLPDSTIIRIYVRTIRSGTQMLTLSPTATGQEIRGMLSNIGWIEDRFFILESLPGRGTRRFQDHWTLSDRSIRDGDTFEMVPAYRVGCRDCPHDETLRSIGALPKKTHIHAEPTRRKRLSSLVDSFRGIHFRINCWINGRRG